MVVDFKQQIAHTQLRHQHYLYVSRRGIAFSTSFGLLRPCKRCIDASFSHRC